MISLKVMPYPRLRKTGHMMTKVRKRTTFKTRYSSSSQSQSEPLMNSELKPRSMMTAPDSTNTTVLARYSTISQNSCRVSCSCTAVRPPAAMARPKATVASTPLTCTGVTSASTNVP